MKEILKPIFESLTGDFTLFDNIIYNYISMGSVGLIAFVVAFWLVGKLYGFNVISSGTAGSIIHWIFRFLVFFVVFYIFRYIILLIKFIMASQWWIWAVAGLVVLAVIITIIALRITERNGGKYSD